MRNRALSDENSEGKLCVGDVRLSICIPTYNRAAKLARQAAFLQSEVKNLHGIELIISDNCSSDDTQMLCADLTGWRINRNEVNVGLVGNLCVLSQLATGRYIWLVGDDDQINPGVVASILEAVDKGPSFVFLNHKIIDSTTGCVVHETALSDGAEWFSDGRACAAEIASKLVGQLMFITSCVYQREHLLGAIRPADNLAAPMYYSFYCASKGSGTIIRQVCLTNFWGNTSWDIHAPQIRQEFIPRIYLRLPGLGYRKALMVSLLCEWYKRNWREAIKYWVPAAWRIVLFLRDLYRNRGFTRL